MNVVIATRLPIPHVSGSNTHIQLLQKVLERRQLFHGLVEGNQVPPVVRFTPAYILRRLRSRYLKDVAVMRHYILHLSRLLDEQTRQMDEVVIHAQDVFALAAALRVSHPRRTVLQTIHGPFSREYLLEVGKPSAEGSVAHRFIQDLEAASYRAADRLIAVDNGQAEILFSDYGIARDKVDVIFNSVDVDAIGVTSRTAPGSEVTKPYFVVPRRLVAKNGPDVALRALAELPAREVQLIMAGEGTMEVALRNLAGELGVRDRVHFLGSVAHDQLFPMLRGAVAAIVPSVPVNGVVEATSLSVLEAMASEVPVIGSGIGGIADILQSDENGFLVPPGDPKALAAAMGTALSLSDAERSALVARAHARVSAGFGLEAWGDRFVGAYTKAQQSRSGK